MSQCRMCESRGQAWSGDAPSCAFPNGLNFQSDNWNCATMNALRSAAEAHHVRHDDQSIGVVPFDNETGRPSAGFVVMCWYKSRGCTPVAFVAGDDLPPQTLTYQLADAVARTSAPSDTNLNGQPLTIVAIGHEGVTHTLRASQALTKEGYNAMANGLAARTGSGEPARGYVRLTCARCHGDLRQDVAHRSTVGAPSVGEVLVSMSIHPCERCAPAQPDVAL